MGIASPRAGWWKEPIHKVELIWIIVAFLWGLGMFFMMIYWHAVGSQNLSNEAYRTTPADFAAKVDKMTEAYTVRQEGAFPVVRPPPGSDVYMMGRVYMWWPMLELVKGETYRLHLSSMDWLLLACVPAIAALPIMAVARLTALWGLLRTP